MPAPNMDVIDFVWKIGGAAGAVASAAFFWLKSSIKDLRHECENEHLRISDKVDLMEQRHNDLHITITQSYVSKEDFRDFRNEQKSLLERIFKKLDQINSK